MARNNPTGILDPRSKLAVFVTACFSVFSGLSNIQEISLLALCVFTTLLCKKWKRAFYTGVLFLAMLLSDLYMVPHLTGVSRNIMTAICHVLRFILPLFASFYLITKTTKISVTMFILYLVMAGRVYEPFGSSFMLMAEMISSLVSIKRTKQMEAIKEQGGQPVCNNQGYDIEFQDVVFTYHADLEDTAVSGRHGERVLNGVSFVAKQGEITALVGPSGGGKSTVSRLAARFWDADSGRVLLGGVDVTTVEPETLFKNYSIVFQEVTLFDQSVMENIRLGRQNATDEEVLAAARAAQCEEFVSRLPEGYQSNIGENGCILSGGERQRISIARAILKDAPVVILDEATASMDAENETLVQQALSELLQGKTVLVIAHRMRTIANADKVVVLDHGQVVEMGTPTELLEENGLFQRLVAAQGGHL